MKGLRKWPWATLPVYNGFTHEERVRGWQLLMFMLDNRLLEKPTVCCISGRRDRVQMHSESYYDWHTYPLNQSIHLALHNRFRSPDRWRAIVAQYTVTGDEWFARLSVTPIDLAGQLRAEQGPEIADIFRRAAIEEQISIPLPSSQ